MVIVSSKNGGVHEKSTGSGTEAHAVHFGPLPSQAMAANTEHVLLG